LNIVGLYTSLYKCADYVSSIFRKQIRIQLTSKNIDAQRWVTKIVRQRVPGGRAGDSERPTATVKVDCSGVTIGGINVGLSNEVTCLGIVVDYRETCIKRLTAPCFYYSAICEPSGARQHQIQSMH